MEQVNMDKVNKLICDIVNLTSEVKLNHRKRDQRNRKRNLYVKSLRTLFEKHVSITG